MLVTNLSKLLLPVWTGIILYLTLAPGKYLVKTPLFSYDKFGHMLVFMIWTALYWFVLDSSSKLSKKQVYIRSTVVSIVFGGFIEILQLTLPISRSAEWYDLLADATGTLLGLVIVVPIVKFIGKKISWY